MAGPISAVPFQFVNGQQLDANQVDSNFTALVAAINAAFSPVGSGQSISSLFPLSKANGGTGQSSVVLLQQRVIVTTAASTAFNSATASSYLSTSFTPVSASSHISIRGNLSHNSQVVAGTSNNQAMMGMSLRRAGSALVSTQSGSEFLSGASAAGTLALALSPSLEWYEASPGTSAVTYAIYCSDVNASGATNTAKGATLIIEEWL